MKKYIKKTIETEVLESIVCDCCKKEFSPKQDWIKTQEFLHINFTGGWESVFGDGNSVECDICPDCLNDLLGKYMRFNNEVDDTDDTDEDE